MSRTTLRRLVGSLLDAGSAELRAGLLRRVSAVVMDTVAVAWAANGDPNFRKLDLLASERGQCSTALQQDSVATVEDAAFYNATAAVWNELDEGYRGAGHPAAHVVPAGVAIAEQLALSGSDLLISVLLGYQLQAQLGVATSLRTEVHAHGVFGAPAAALTVASLMGLDADRATEAVNIAANLAPAGLWESCLQGKTVRHSFAGTGAQIGIRAAQLAAGGMTAPVDSCEVGYGVIRGTEFVGWNEFDGSWALGDGYLKQWSACAYAHAALDVVANVCNRHDIRAEEVLYVSVSVPAVGALLSEIAYEPILAVRFSLPTLIALAMSGYDLRNPRTADLVSKAVRDLALRVRVTEDDTMTASWPLQSQARVVIGLSDQRKFMGETVNPATPTSDEDFAMAVASKASQLHPSLSSGEFSDRIDALTEAHLVSDIFSVPIPVLDALDLQGERSRTGAARRSN